MRGFVKSIGNLDSSKDTLYGHLKERKEGKRIHPMFDYIKTKELKERAEYLQMIRNRHLGLYSRDHGRFDSLKLLGSTDDVNYLDAFMSVPRRRHPSDESEVRSRPRSLTKGVGLVYGSKGQKGGLSESAVKVAMLGSIRSAASEDSLYESVEMIHYRKTLQSLNRQNKTRSVQRTGHPLFDALREEQALREPKHPPNKRACDLNSRLRTTDCHTSDGNSPSHSSSSSDEYDHIPQRNMRTQKVQRYEPNPSKNNLVASKCEAPVPKGSLQRHKEPSGSESDDDWIIPRPKLATKPQRPRRPGLPQYYSSQSTDESDSSSKSTGLR